MIQYRSQGQILGPDGQRMSKSRGNVIDPDEQVRQYGADTVRAYLMFGYRWSEGGPWMTENIQGVVRWLHRVWSVIKEGGPAEGEGDTGASRGLRRKVHQTIQSVTADIEAFEFNTIVSALMELTNTMQEAQGKANVEAWDEAADVLLRLMAPITPHIAEELWAHLGKAYSVHTQSWPDFDAEAAKEDEITLVVQVNGKLRDRITVPAGISEDEAKEKALASEIVQQFLDGKTPKKVIVIQGKLVNLVI
jgi:leucyl-tRNA synthetase